MLRIDMLSMPTFLLLAQTSTMHPPLTLKYQWRLRINACLKVWDQVVPAIHRERMQADGLLIQEEAVVVQVTSPWMVAAADFLSSKKKRNKEKKQKWSKSAWMLQILYELLPQHLFCYSCNFCSVTLNGKASLARRVENRLILRKECLPEFQRPAHSQTCHSRSIKELPSNKMFLSLLSFGLCFEVLTSAKPSPTPRLLFVAQEIPSSGRLCRFSPSSSVACWTKITTPSEDDNSRAIRSVRHHPRWFQLYLLSISCCSTWFNLSYHSEFQNHRLVEKPEHPERWKNQGEVFIVQVQAGLRKKNCFMSSLIPRKRGSEHHEVCTSSNIFWNRGDSIWSFCHTFWLLGTAKIVIPGHCAMINRNDQQKNGGGVGQNTHLCKKNK